METNFRISGRYAFVDFNDPIVATIAIEDLNGTKLNGRKVEVKQAFSKEEVEQREARRRRAEMRLEAERRAALGVSGDDVEVSPKEFDAGATDEGIEDVISGVNPRGEQNDAKENRGEDDDEVVVSEERNVEVEAIAV